MLFEDKLEIKKYKIAYSRQAVHITMRDGIKIAADVHFANIEGKEKLPSILMQTRYWRRQILRKGLGFLEKMMSKQLRGLLSYGYNVVYIDVRGTGASFGSRPYPWSEDEVADMKDIAEWIVNQPWSDGKIVSFGVSYTGSTSELSSSIDHPAYLGHVFAHCEYDPFIDIAYPGGVYNESFVKMWGNMNENLDNNTLKGVEGQALFKLLVKSVAPIDADSSGDLIRLAVKDHQTNLNVHNAAINASFRDDHFGTTEGATTQSFSIYRYTDRVKKINRPLLYYGSWYDAGTANSGINRFLNYTNPLIVVIGSWAHSFETNGDPLLKEKQTVPSYERVFSENMRFMNERCDKKPFSSRYIQYLTVGESKWKTTEIWPPEGFVKTPWYFGGQNVLSEDKPGVESATDSYTVDYTATSGKITRWSTEMGGGVRYKNRAKEDRKLLTYTSTPLEQDIEITGHPEISITMSASREDVALFVYLEQISPDGHVYYITEGQFRLINRKKGDGTSPYPSVVIPHNFTRGDHELLTPGKKYKVEFSLHPISILVPKGNRLRVAIAGADEDNFKRYPEKGETKIHLFRDNVSPSAIHLPSNLR